MLTAQTYQNKTTSGSCLLLISHHFWLLFWRGCLHPTWWHVGRGRTASDPSANRWKLWFSVTRQCPALGANTERRESDGDAFIIREGGEVRVKCDHSRRKKCFVSKTAAKKHFILGYQARQRSWEPPGLVWERWGCSSVQSTDTSPVWTEQGKY